VAKYVGLALIPLDILNAKSLAKPFVKGYARFSLAYT